jgi:hypothetical protein
LIRSPTPVPGDARIRLVVLERNEIDWKSLEGAPERNLFQSHGWLEFIAESKRATPVVAAVMEGSSRVGHFTGLIVNRYGVRALGSPLPGWTTPYMGFSLHPSVDRTQAAQALLDVAFNELSCIHVELRDRWFRPGELEHIGFTRRADCGYDERTFEIDLTLPEETLFANMSSACRRCIRKSEKMGLAIEEVPPDDPTFPEEYFAQLSEVFARQSLVPTYGVQRVRTLIRHLGPTGSLLLLRARDSDGQCIATGIFPGMADVALFWGGASWREHQGNRPNEALQWYAMRYWKSRGARRYDMGGFVEYKRKYGGEELTIPGYRFSRYPLVAAARSIAPIAMRARQMAQAHLRRLRPVELSH